MTATRICVDCAREQPIEQYLWRKDRVKLGATGSMICRTCQVLNSRLKNHRLGKLEWLEFWLKQDGACAICRRKFSESKDYIDHDHKTGKIRGLLCVGCNAALGRFGDNIEGVKRVLTYLEGAENGN